jgi:transcriptional regulator with XRE-family HTH domain
MTLHSNGAGNGAAVTVGADHPYDRTRVEYAIDRIQTAVRQKSIRQQEIASALNIEKTKLSRWLNRKVGWAAIGKDTYLRLMDYVEKRNILSRGLYALPEEQQLRNMTFHGMANFFGIDQREISIARKKLVGHYISYRYSYYAAPHILRGYLRISFDEDTQSLRTSDHYRIPQSHLGPDSAEINFRRHGYVWPTKLDMYMVIAEKVEKKDIQVMYLNKSLLNSHQPTREDDIQAIEGVLLDWQGPDFYMTKVFLQKVNKPPPDKMLTLMTDKETPSLVLKKLQEPFMGPHKYLRAYK